MAEHKECSKTYKSEVRVIKVVREINQQQWTDFVYQHPHGNIFQTPEMYEVYKNTRNYEPIFLAIVGEQNEILGVLLSAIQREYSGFIGDFTARSIIWGGPLIKNEDVKILECALREYDNVVKRKAIYSQFRNLWDAHIFKTAYDNDDYTFEEHLNIIVDLTTKEELVWKNIYPQKRNKIRRALKRGTTVRELNDIKDVDAMYKILHDVYQKIKLPIPDKSMFIAAFNVLAGKNMVKYFGAFNEDHLIGVRCVLTYRKKIYDWYAGSLGQHLNKYPNDLLPWEVFKWGQQHGYTLFDFGGAGNPKKEYGVRDFKKQFGGEFVNFGRFEKIHQPMKFAIARAGFKVLQKIRR